MTIPIRIAFMAAPEVIKAGVEAFRIHEEEETRREYIRANYQAFLDALQSRQEVILAYFDHRFAERRGQSGGILPTASPRRGNEQ